MGYVPIDPAGFAMAGTRNALNIANNVGEQRRGQEARDYMAQNGAGILAGNQNALAGLMPYNPQLAMRQQQNMIGNRRAETAADQNTQLFNMKVAEYKRGISQEQAASEAAGITQAVTALRAASNPDEWDAIARQTGATDLVGEFGNEAAINGAMKMAWILSKPEAPQPQSPDGKRAADVAAGILPETPAVGFRPATPDEAAKYGAKSGQIDEETGRFYPITPPSGMKMVSDGKGGFTFEQGSGVTGGSSDTMGMDVSGAPAMISSIDGVLTDPALDWATGWMAWSQKIPGTDAYRFGTRVDQLNGQAFLQAFQSLKGGGQITEVEGNKATQAIGRLDSAQHADDYRQALQELRDILVLGQSRPKGWTGNREQSTPDIGAIEGGHRFLGGDPANPASWEVVK